MERVPPSSLYPRSPYAIWRDVYPVDSVFFAPVQGKSGAVQTVRWFVRKWLKHRCPFSIDLREQWADIFAIMVGIGSFRLTGDHYEMVVPSEPIIEVITEAIKQVVETEDEQSYLHPSRFLVTTTGSTPWFLLNLERA